MPRTIKVLAVASGGGHWQQLMLLRRALEPFATTFATTDGRMALRSGVSSTLNLFDCSRQRPMRAMLCALQLGYIVLRRRPDVVISTGALPGAMALVVGKLFGARTIWIDSIANAEVMSSSARSVRRFADLWLSQWQDVAAASGALWRGSVL